MWAYFVVLADPGVEIGLQLIDGTIHLLAECDTIEFVQHGLVEALTDAVGLRALPPATQLARACAIRWRRGPARMPAAQLRTQRRRPRLPERRDSSIQAFCG